MKHTMRMSVVLLGAILLSSEVSAKNCNFANAKGTYGFSTQGTLHSPSSPSAPSYIAVVGTVTLDKNGNVVTNRTTSLNGVITTNTLSGTAAVNPDCTGTISNSDGTTYNLVGMFNNKNSVQEIFIIGTTPGLVATGTAKRQK